MGSDEVTVRADGRWRGRLTSRPIPADDPTLAALTDAQRGALVAVWIGRAASERRVADSFDVIRATLERLGADPSLVALAARAVDDEVRHAEICRATASRVARAEIPAPPRLPNAIPAHANAPDALRPVLHVVGQCCLNETLASAFLEACFAAAEAPVARAVLRELLSDEVDHARIGWAYLATTPAPVREALGPWLARLTRANLRSWRETPREYTDDPALVAQGAPSLPIVEAALVGAIRDLIVPGFERLGVPTAGVRAWLDAGASTA